MGLKIPKDKVDFEQSIGDQGKIIEGIITRKRSTGAVVNPTYDVTNPPLNGEIGESRVSLSNPTYSVNSSGAVVNPTYDGQLINTEDGVTNPLRPGLQEILGKIA